MMFRSKRLLQLRPAALSCSFLNTSKLHKKSLRKYNILFFGSDAFSLETLKVLENEYRSGTGKSVTHLEVVCPQDRPQGRGLEIGSVAVKEYALEKNLTVHHPPNLKSLKDWNLPTAANGQQFDVAVAVSFRYFIPQRILKQFRVAAVNIHPSLLPKYRGAAPIHWTILNGDEETGVTIQELHAEKFDAGRILHQVRVPVEKDIVYHQLYEKLSKIGAQNLLSLISSPENFEKLVKDCPPADETALEAGLDAPKVTKEQGNLLFSKESNTVIYNKWRAFAYNVTAYTFISNKRLLVREMVPLEQVTRLVNELSANPEFASKMDMLPCGSLIYWKNVLLVKCAEGWVGCSKVQPESKKETAAASFAQSYKLLADKDMFPPSLQCEEKI